MSKNRTESLFGEMEDSRHKDAADECKHVIRLAFETAADSEFDYAVPDELWPIQPGQRLEAPFGKNNKLQKGFCVEIVDRDSGLVTRDSGNGVSSHETRATSDGIKPRFKLKAVTKVIDKEPLIDSELMELARWISSYYVCPLGQVLAAIVPAAVKHGAGVKTQNNVYPQCQR